MKSKLIYISTFFLLIPALSFADAKIRTVTATGRGEVFIPQTIATLQLSVNEDGKTAIEAQEHGRVKSNQLLKTLKSAKTLNIETTSVTVNPTMSYTNNKPKIIGYSANYTVQVKCLIENAGNIIDQAITNGATIVNAPSLAVNDADRSKAEKEAIKLATLQARSHAEAALSAVGFKAITINQITVQNNNDNRPQPRMFTAMKANDADGTPPTQIISGKDDVTADVSVTMEY